MCEEKTKACSKCGIEKPLTEYNKKKKAKDGLRAFCRECKRAIDKQYRQENAEKEKARQKKWREENPEYGKKWREDNPEYDKKSKAYQKKWFENNREKARLYYQKRRALLAEATTEHFTHEDLLDFWSENKINYKECFYCEKEMSEGPEHIDHYYPLSKGGPHERANLRPSCAHCNLVKSAKQPETFMEELKNGL